MIKGFHIKRIGANCSNKIYDAFVDRCLHVETAKSIQLQEHDNVINFMYEPSPYRQLKNLFKKHPILPDDHIIDFGCGKGRVLVLAGEYGCRNLYGIDISSSLLDIADKNLRRLKQKHSMIEFELLCMDAKRYEINREINKVFFYNPFQLRVFIHVFKSLLHSIDENPRTITVYFHDTQQSVLDHFSRLNVFKLIENDEKRKINIYRYTQHHA